MAIKKPIKKKPKKQRTKLTIMEEKFCLEYCRTGRKRESAIYAGYSEKSAQTTASHLLLSPIIKNEIERIKSNIMESAGISALAVAMELKNIGFSSVSNMFDNWMKVKDFEKLSMQQKASISDIKVTQKTFNGIKEDIVQFKLHDKLKALEMLSKMFGLNEPEKLMQSVEIKSIPVIEWVEENEK
jgi:phage terminase small subunit